MYTTINLSHIKLSAPMLSAFMLSIKSLTRFPISVVKMFVRLCVLSAAIAMVSACASQPKDNSFVGPGAFNPQEAARTRVSLGLTYLKNGNFSQAKFNLDKALEFAPRSGEAHYAMAFYYQQVDEIARAEEYYQSAIGYSRNDPDVLNSYGAFLCKQGDYAKAKDFFLKAVDSKSYISTAGTYENLAICAQSQGLLQDALGYFESALNHQPTRASSLLSVAQINTELGEWENAKKALWKFERNAQVNAESLWLSYQIAQGQNDIKTATEYADLLKRLFPEHKHTQVALTQLGKFRPSMSVTQKQRPAARDVVPSAPLIAPPVVVNEPTEQTVSQTVVQTSDNQEASAQNGSDQAQSLSSNATAAAEKTAAAAAGPNDKPAETVKDTDTLVSNSDVEAYRESVEKMMRESSSPLKTADETSEPLSTLNESAQETLVEDGYHIVAPKENLYRISLKYNVKMKKLLEWNDLTDASAIRIGTKLRVRDPNINE